MILSCVDRGKRRGGRWGREEEEVDDSKYQ